MPRHHNDLHALRDGPRPMINRGPRPVPLHPAALEEELELQHREIQRILADNRHVVDENVMLERELVDAKDEILKLNQVLPKLRADGDARARELIERGLKLEADLRATEPLRAEVMQLRGDAQQLNSLRRDLTAQIQGLTEDITRLRKENEQVTSMRAEVDKMHKELMEVRRALDYEKKANEEQFEQKQSMEKNLVSMAHEIEKLRSEQLRGEQLNVDRMAHGLGGQDYGLYSLSSDLRYPGSSYTSNGYGGAWGTGAYDKRGPLPRR